MSQLLRELGTQCSWWLLLICRWLSHPFIVQQRTWARIVQLVVVFGFAGGYPTLPFCSSAPGQALQLVAVLDLQVVIPPYLRRQECDSLPCSRLSSRQRHWDRKCSRERSLKATGVLRSPMSVVKQFRPWKPLEYCTRVLRSPVRCEAISSRPPRLPRINVVPWWCFLPACFHRCVSPTLIPGGCGGRGVAPVWCSNLKLSIIRTCSAVAEQDGSAHFRHFLWVSSMRYFPGSFLPTCQVRVVRFYGRSSSLPAPLLPRPHVLLVLSLPFWSCGLLQMSVGIARLKHNTESSRCQWRSWTPYHTATA